MGKQHNPAGSTHLSSPLSVLLRNLRLLDLDKRDDWPEVSFQAFTGKDSPQNQKIRIQYVEWVAYRLYEIWDLDECQNKLQPFFPPLEPLQSINLRAALFRCLNELKRNGTLGKDITLRKSMFDDCKGDKLQELLSAFSTIVLRELLSSEAVGRSSIVGHLCLSQQVHPKHHASLLPLAIAHRTSLRALLHRKEDLASTYRDFSHALTQKESDLGRKFEKVVETQEFLDRNVPSESTVSRVAKVLEKDWQGDRRLVDVIAQGEEHGIQDALLDQEFATIWPEVSSGNFNGDISTSRHGLLEDLEKRVAAQKARLQLWKIFKTDLEHKKQSTKAKPEDSPTRQIYVSPKSQRYEQRKGKDLVFSPRKSPRKSMWPLDSPARDAATEHQKEMAVNETTDQSKSIPRADRLGQRDNSPQELKPRVLFASDSKDLPSSNSFGTEDDDSGFSEVSTGDLEARLENAEERNPASDSPQRVSSLRKTRELDTISTPETKNAAEKGVTEKPNEDKLLAEKMIFYTLNASPTPLKPKLSLAERTRQSMAFTSPGAKLSNEATPPQLPRKPSEETAPSTAADVRVTLAERTRQSIALVPGKSQKSRASMARRTSKIYPTNQFETPRRQTTVQRLTPPEELFSPRAGYDSVFKSRPKIAFSPTTSPVPDDESGGEPEIEKPQGSGQLDDSSPLARLTARA